MGSWAHEWGGTSVPRASLLTLGKSANIYVSASLFVNEDTMVHISKANGRTYEVPLVKFQSRYQCRATITNTSCSYQWKWKLLSHVRLCDPLDYTVHGMLQARILEWVAVPFSRGSSWPRDRIHHCQDQMLPPLSCEGMLEAIAPCWCLLSCNCSCFASSRPGFLNLCTGFILYLLILCGGR